MQTFTCLVKKEGKQYASLCIELDVASCGRTKAEAVEGVKNAIEAYIEYMVSENRGHELSRPVPMDELREFLFTQDTKDEQSFKAISLDFEYA
jgi:predicted RNase H-like HicB family nuclease